MRKLVAALGTALERSLSDPGARPIRIKTGSVVLSGFMQAADTAVPASRVRQITPSIEQRWEPVPVNLEHVSLAELAKITSTGNIPIAGWRVSYHAVKPRDAWENKSPDEIREHVLSLQLAPEDDVTYNGYYPTIKGNDVAHHDPTRQGMEAFRGGRTLKGNPTYDANGRLTHDGTIRGGTEIRGGRAEYRRATKGYEPFDAGYFKHVERIKKAQQAKRDQATQTALQKIDAKLPRKIGEL